MVAVREASAGCDSMEDFDVSLPMPLPAVLEAASIPLQPAARLRAPTSLAARAKGRGAVPSIARTKALKAAAAPPSHGSLGGASASLDSDAAAQAASRPGLDPDSDVDGPGLHPVSDAGRRSWRRTVIAESSLSSVSRYVQA